MLDQMSPLLLLLGIKARRIQLIGAAMLYIGNQSLRSEGVQSHTLPAHNQCYMTFYFLHEQTTTAKR